jgi:branched-chain amino acid transport system substrate-binding protein
MRYLNGLRTTRLGTLAVLIAAGSLVAAVCASAAVSTKKADKTLAFGLLVPLSGPAAAFGPPHRASVATAVKRINDQGGIKVGGDTYKIDLKVYDSAFDPTKAVSKAREAISRDGVKFLAIDGGVVTSAVQPVAERAKVVVFALAGGDSYLGKKHPMTFRYYYSIPESLQAGLTVLKPSLPKNPKVLNFYPDDDIARSISKQSAERAKKIGFRTSAVFVGRDVTDFNSVLTKVVAEKADVIDFGVMPPSQYAVAVKQARQLGYKGKFVFDDTLYLDTVVKAAGKASVVGSVSVPYFGNFTGTEGKYWYANIGKQPGGDKSQGWTALGYDNVLLFKAAVEKAQSIDPQKVADALREVSTAGVLGKVSYGGKDLYGINQVFNIQYGVAKVTAGGTLKKVAVVDVNK